MRAKSLLVDFLFTSVSLSHGDDARPVIARRMGYDNQTPVQQAQSDEPFFAVGESVVFEGNAGPGKYLLGILEAEAMLGDVLPVLRLVPVVFHSISNLNCSSFCSYTQCRKNGIGGRLGPINAES